jgi:hypothetical protein
MSTITIIMMEAGAYAAQSVREMLGGRSQDFRLLSFDQKPEYIPTADNGPRLVEHAIEMSSDINVAVEQFAEALIKYSVYEAFVLPTSEFMAVMRYHPAIPDLISRHGLHWLAPSEKAYRASRDKKLLYEFSASLGVEFVEPVFESWSVDTPFAKPYDGVGARGCRKIFTREEGLFLAENGYVFQRELPGEEHVVDVVRRPDGRFSHAARVVYKARGGADEIVGVYSDPESVLVTRTMRFAEAFESPVINVQWRAPFLGAPLDEFRVIDIGTRFSGACYFSLDIGVDLLEGFFGPRPMTPLKSGTTLARRVPVRRVLC